jgi:hypothetical protein
MKSSSSDDLEESDGDSNEFSMGNNVTLTLSNQVQIDDVWQEMPSGYPKLVTQGSKKVRSVCPISHVPREEPIPVRDSM